MRRLPLPLLLALACAEPTTPAPLGYTLVDVHGLARFGDCASAANSVNAARVVVGQLTCGFGPGENVGFVYQDGLIGLLDAGGRTFALDVNDAGQILVQGDTARPPIASELMASWLTSLADLDARAYRPIFGIALNASGDLVGNVRGPYDSAGAHVGGVAMALGTVGGRVSGALGLNDAGVVVGWSETGGFGVVAVRWVGGVGTALPLFETGEHLAAAINNAGIIVGWGRTADPSSPIPPVPLRWEGTTVTALPTLGGAGGWAYDINAAGDIVGATLTPDGFLHATLWRDGVAMDLGTREGVTESIAVRISDNGDIVGSSGGRAVMWRRN